MGSHFWFSETEDASHLEIGSESEVRRIRRKTSQVLLLPKAYRLSAVFKNEKTAEIPAVFLSIHHLFCIFFI